MPEKCRGEAHHDGGFFFFNDTATTEIYTLSLHDALPIWSTSGRDGRSGCPRRRPEHQTGDRKSTRLNSSHLVISYAVFCLKKKKPHKDRIRLWYPYVFGGIHARRSVSP